MSIKSRIKSLSINSANFTAISKFPKVEWKNIHFIANIPIALIALFYLFNIRDGHIWQGDFSMYILNASNIVKGLPYAQTNYIYNVDTAFYGPRAYPPIFPLMLAPMIAVWGVNLPILKLVGIACFVALVLYLDRHILPENFPPILRIIYILLIGFYPPFFGQADSVMSDFPFMLLCVISLKRINDQVFSDHPEKLDWPGALLTGVTIYLAYGTRTIGVCLFRVLFFLDLIRNKSIRFSTVISLCAAFLLVVLQALLIPETGSYLDQFPKTIAGVAMLLVNSSFYYFQMFARIFPFDNFIVQDIIFLLSLEFSLMGLLMRLKNQATGFELFFLFYFVFLLLWPTYQGLRFIFPILPFYFLFCLEGIQRLVHLIKSPNWLPKVIPVVLLVGLGLYYAAAYTSLVPRPVSDIEKRETQDLFQFVRNRTNSDDVIVFFNSRVLALFTNRKSVSIAVPSPDGDTLGRMKDFGVDYVIVRLRFPIEYQPELIQLIKENPVHFQPVYENADFRMYAVSYDAKE